MFRTVFSGKHGLVKTVLGDFIAVPMDLLERSLRRSDFRATSRLDRGGKPTTHLFGICVEVLLLDFCACLVVSV